MGHWNLIKKKKKPMKVENGRANMYNSRAFQLFFFSVDIKLLINIFIPR